jgi:hypothetical protein
LALAAYGGYSFQIYYHLKTTSLLMSPIMKIGTEMKLGNIYEKLLHSSPTGNCHG